MLNCSTVQKAEVRLHADLALATRTRCDQTKRPESMKVNVLSSGTPPCLNALIQRCACRLVVAMHPVP